MIATTRWPTALTATVLLFSSCSAAMSLSDPTEATPPTTTTSDSTTVATDPPFHLIYLHGAIVEGDDPRPEHPRHGTYEYPEIVAAFEAEGFTVHSEHRPRGTDPGRYAIRLAEEIRRWLEAGVPPDRIAVVGHSKGGAIALLAATQLSTPGLRWVFLAGCFPSTPSTVRPVGRLLSVFDSADRIAVSCRPWFVDATAAEEIELSTGRGHGLFFRPDPTWLEPVVEWLHADPRGDPTPRKTPAARLVSAARRTGYWALSSGKSSPTSRTRPPTMTVSIARRWPISSRGSAKSTRRSA